MAFFAELKRRKWYCVNQFNAIRWYRKYLYDEWYNSLTDEQKQKLEEYRRKKKEKEEREAKEAIQRLAYMTATIAGLSNRKYDKYHGLYNSDGTINEQYLEDKQ